MLCAIDSAGKQEVFASELSQLYLADNSDESLLGNFELDGPMKRARSPGYGNPGGCTSNHDEAQLDSPS
ncbi:MAG: hypothetical protein HLUCCO06_14070 [Halomonas sp. HL-93]|nr:MAG: hypothetical protein HLUCCO06_14070 [Halomonas sp. HL-93]